MRSSLFLSLFTLSAFAAAHSTHQRRVPTSEELAHEEIRARDRVVKARNCEPELREHLAMRMRRRSDIMRREANAAGRSTHVPRDTPHYTTIQNTTCLTAPEVTEGPYYINNGFVRQDIRESQQGAKLVLDFGVMDTSTCSPMNYTFVEIWHANSTGSYCGYESNNFNGSETFLRGGWYTDSNGIVEITTNHPGYYTGRAPHIHIMVHKDWSESANGTLVSHAGTVLHIGQTFFNESLNDEVFKTSPYSSNTNSRTTNSEDSLISGAFESGYNAYTSVEYINGKDLSDGLVGYLTLGVDSSASHSITNKNYNGATSTSTGSSNGTTSGSNNGTSSDNGTTSSSGAEPLLRGWGSTFCLSLLTFAFFGYKAQLHLA